MKEKLLFAGLFILLIFFSVVALLPLDRQAVKQQIQAIVNKTINNQSPTQTSVKGPVGFLLSNNVPAYASSANYPASYANDGNFDTVWRSQGSSGWLAYDLSQVSSSLRKNVLVVWYNETYNYDHTLIGYPAYNMPQDYTIDVNPAPGGNVPATGWQTLVTVKGNHYHSRQHLIDMTGNNWVRLDFTAVDGVSQNYDVSLNMDIYQAPAILSDDWIFYGDSITAGAMSHYTIGGVASFADLIHQHAPTNYPVQESGGIGYLTSSDGAKYMDTWLQLFPGKYVALSYGTNDAAGCINVDTFYNNYVAMVQDVLKLGKVPIIPTIPWGRHSNIQRCGPAFNSKIAVLYQTFPQIIKGPDLWTFFQSHQNLISQDNIHPTNDGFGAYRQQWANSMLTSVYKVSA